jgi:hypothetical protein
MSQDFGTVGRPKNLDNNTLSQAAVGKTDMFEFLPWFLYLLINWMT